MPFTHRTTYRGLKPSSAVQSAIQQHLRQLDTDCTEIADCEIVVELWHQHQQAGRNYRVVLEVARHDGAVLRAGSFEQAQLEDALRAAFEGIAARLGAPRPGHHSNLSAEARRLLPLHGLVMPPPEGDTSLFDGP